MEKEIWKDILGYKNYKISSYGRILNKKKNKILKSTVYKKRYPQVSLSEQNVKRSEYVHRLVALVFCVGYKKGMQVNHKDGVKSNNNVSNLEWVTPKENTKHAIKNNLYKHKNGTNWWASKLKEQDVIEIRKMASHGIRHAIIAEKYNIKKSSVSSIVTRVNWSHI